MGGEGDNESKRRHLERHMADFHHIQYSIKKEQEKKGMVKEPGCRNDILLLLQIIQQLGGFKYKQLLPTLNKIRGKYRL